MAAVHTTDGSAAMPSCLNTTHIRRCGTEVLVLGQQKGRIDVSLAALNSNLF
jgi:hypothetical protein